ncbi:MAG: HD domain-containing protein [Chloroflexota bacterium]
MNRREILASVRANVQDKSTRSHILATEAIMRSLASRLDQDEQEWALAALLHDIDVELVGDDDPSHSKLAADIALELGAPESVYHAILCHNQAHGLPRETLLDRGLFCADALSRLITAAAHADPASLGGLTAETLRQRFHQEGFAPEADRTQLAECHELGLGLGETLALGLEAMVRARSDLAL